MTEAPGTQMNDAAPPMGSPEVAEAEDADREPERYCFDAQVAEVMNGIVAKVGCMLFVGKRRDISMLATYFAKKEVPQKLRQFVEDENAFSRGACPDGNVGEELLQEGPGRPSFIEPYAHFVVHKAVNGWLVLKHGQCYVATNKDELLEVICEEAQGLSGGTFQED